MITMKMPLNLGIGVMSEEMTLRYKSVPEKDSRGNLENFSELWVNCDEDGHEFVVGQM